MALPVGTIIRGRYLVQVQLSTSSLGDVYLVRDQLSTLKNPIFYVLKEVINPNKHKLYQIASNGMALRLVRHEALPRVYNVLSDAKYDRVYVQMEYIEGSNLEVLRLRRPENRFSFPETLTIMTPILDAVAYLHSQQPPILHQDIKPANIIVSLKREMIMLVDVGVGKQDKLSSTGTTDRHSLTPYEAPEQYTGETNARSDIYGLGATFYTLLTGIIPFDALYRASRSIDPLEPVNQTLPTISPLVAGAIHLAMSLNSSDRFSSVQQFEQALKADPRLQALSKLKLLLILHELDLSLKPDSVEQKPLEPIIAPTATTQSQINLAEQKSTEAFIVPSVPTVQQAPVPEVKPLPLVAEEPSVPEVAPPVLVDQVPPVLEVTPLPVVGEEPPVPEAVPSSQVAEEPPVSETAPEVALPVSAYQEPVVPEVVAPSLADQEPTVPEVVLLPVVAEEPPMPEVVPSAIKAEEPTISEVVPVSEEAEEPPVPEVVSSAPTQSPVIPEKTVEPPAESLPGQPRTVLSRKLGVLLPISVALLIAIIFGAIYLPSIIHPNSSSATPTAVLLHKTVPRSTPSPSSTTFTNLAGSYNGTISSIATSVTTKMSLTGIQQSKGNFSGDFAGLHLSGALGGMVDASRHIQFTVMDSAGQAFIFFEGAIQSDGNVAGSYCNLDQKRHCTGDYGVWSVAPA